MSSQSSCGICCDQYNQSVRKQIKCPFSDCEFSCCKTCVRTYLIGTTADPHCMGCKKSWNEKFLVENLNRSFCEKKYKIHRKDLLVDREISKLPETMHLAECQKQVDVEEQKLKALYLQLKALNTQVLAVKQQRAIVSQNIYHIKNGTDKNGKAPDRRKFIMACPNNRCRGYLSTQYKCELCELFTCPDCLEIVGYTKTEPHTCNPDCVASAEMIRKDTKPCPQCGVRIFKISGCNQMWCTECRIAFDYLTLKIDKGNVHNPHYYQHLQQQNGGAAPRNPHDVLCGGLLSVQNLHHFIFNKLKTAISDEEEYETMVAYLTDIHRTIAHFTHYDLPQYRAQVRLLENGEDLRIKYILGKIDKKEMGTAIYRRDLTRKRRTELLHLYELMSVVGIENFNVLSQYVRDRMGNPQFVKEVEGVITVLDNLREWCNHEFAKISVTYNTKVIEVTDLWQFKSHKYKIAELKA